MSNDEYIFFSYSKEYALYYTHNISVLIYYFNRWDYRLVIMLSLHESLVEIDEADLACVVCLELSPKACETVCCGITICEACFEEVNGDCVQCRQPNMKIYPSINLRRRINNLNDRKAHIRSLVGTYTKTLHEDYTRDYKTLTELCETYNIEHRYIEPLSFREDVSVVCGDMMLLLVVGGRTQSALSKHRQPIKAGIIPPDLVPAYRQCAEAYLQDGRRHRLQPRLDFGTAEIEIVFRSGTHSFVCSTYQMLILCALDGDSKPKSPEALADQIGCHIDNILEDIRILLRYKILIVRDNFCSLNADYTTNMGQVRLPMAWNEATIGRQELASLRYRFESTILRLLCSYREMKKHHLIAEVSMQLQSFISRHAQKQWFTLFKTAMDSLIEREYVETKTIDGELWYIRII